MKYDAGSIEHGPEIAHVSFRVVWNDDNCIVLTDDASFLNEPACFRVQRQPGPPGSLLGLTSSERFRSRPAGLPSRNTRTDSHFGSWLICFRNPARTRYTPLALKKICRRTREPETDPRKSSRKFVRSVITALDQSGRVSTLPTVRRPDFYGHLTPHLKRGRGSEAVGTSWCE